MTDATDNFNRANGPLGSNWVDSPSFTGLSIVSNAANSASANWMMAYWNPSTNTFANDQHSDVSVVANNTVSFVGPVVRHQLSGVSSSGYFAFAVLQSGGQQVLLYRFDTGTFALLGAGPITAINPGDIISLVVSGSSFAGLLNGVSQITASDATYTSGQPGIAAYINSLDNWVGGPITGAGAISTGQSSSPVIRRSARVINT